jgi:hypothetical protein
MGEIMKTIAKSLFVLLVLSSVASAEWVNLIGGAEEPVEPSVIHVESNNSHVVFDLVIPGFESFDLTVKVDEENVTFQKISLPNHSTLAVEGDPDLPVVSFLITLPDYAELDDPTYTERTATILDDYYIYPAESFAETVEDYDTGSEVNVFTINNDAGEVYGEDDFYPETVVLDVDDLGYLYDQRLGRISFCPFQFNPDTDELRVITQCGIELTYEAEQGETISWNTNPVGQYHAWFNDVCVNYNWSGNISDPSASNPDSAGSLYWFDDSWDDEDLDDLKCDYLVIIAEEFEGMLDDEDPDTENVTGYLDDLLRWRSVDNNSPDKFDIMVAKLDDVVPYMSGTVPPAERTTSTNFKVAELLDQFIDRIWTKTTADHTLSGRCEYLLLVGDSHSDGDWAEDETHGVSFNGGVTPVTFNWHIEHYIMSSAPSQQTPSYNTDIPSIMCDKYLHKTHNGIAGIHVPVYTDLIYADTQTGVGDTDYDEALFYEYEATFCIIYPESCGESDYLNYRGTLSPAEMMVGRITADNELVEDDCEDDNRNAVEVMSDICKKILDFEKNPPQDTSYRREVCTYDGTNGDGVFEARWDCIETYLTADDRYWDQQGYNVNYLVGYEYSDEEHLEGDLTDDIVDLFDPPGIARDGELIFIYQNHGGRGSWNPLLKEDWPGGPPPPGNASPVFVITNDDVDDFENGPYYPVVFSLCCTTGDYIELGKRELGDGIVAEFDQRENGPDDRRCLAETLLRDEDGGAMAVWAGVTGTDRGKNQKQVVGVSRALLEHNIEDLGNVCEFLRYVEGYREDSYKYHLFGDPALNVSEQWRDKDKPDLQVDWADAWINDDRDGDISDNHYPYLDSGSGAQFEAYAVVTNIGYDDSSSTTATFKFYSKTPTDAPSLIDTISNVNVPALDPGESTTVSAAYDFPPIGLPDNGEWQNALGVPLKLFITCEITPNNNEISDDNNYVGWPDDNVKSYDPNPDWEFDPEDEDDDVEEDYCENVLPICFFPNLDNYPDKLASLDPSGETLPYVVIAKLDSSDDPKGIVVIKGTPYILDESGINAVTFSGLGTDNLIAVASGNLDADSNLEIVGLSKSKVYAWEAGGSSISGWPKNATTDYVFFNELVLSDIDNDAKSDVIVAEDYVESGSDQKVRVFNESGTELWSDTFPENHTIVLSSGNIDGSAGNEIIASVGPAYEGTGVKKRLYAWDSSGNGVLDDEDDPNGKFYELDDITYRFLICDYDDDNTVEMLGTRAATPIKGYAYTTIEPDPESSGNYFQAELDGGPTSPWAAADVVTASDQPEFFCGVLDADTPIIAAEMFEYDTDTPPDETYYDPDNAQTAYSPVIADFDPTLDSKVDIAFGCGNGYVFFGPVKPTGPTDVTDLFPTGLQFIAYPDLDIPAEYITNLGFTDLDGDDEYDDIVGITNLGNVFAWETDCNYDEQDDVLYEQYLHDEGHTNYADEF